MSASHIQLTEPLANYLREVSLREPGILTRLRAETASLPMARMQITPEQGQFMGLLVQLLGAKHVIEIGVFTGYSSLAVALALPPEGRITACDVSEEWTAIARRYWKEAGVADKIDLNLGPALDTLRRLEAERASYDFAFIDADKANYDSYYEALLKLVRPGGLIAIDNVLWHGSVIDSAAQDEDTVAIRQLNAKLSKDPRITVSMLPIGDGLTLALRR